jgi:hypothetical protein
MMNDKKGHLMWKILIAIFIFYAQEIKFYFLIKEVCLALMFQGHKEEIVKYLVLKNNNFYKQFLLRFMDVFKYILTSRFVDQVSI